MTDLPNSSDKKRVARLVFQCSVPVADISDGEMFYDRLKDFLSLRGTGSTLSGQIVQLLEPCCGDKKP